MKKEHIPLNKKYLAIFFSVLILSSFVGVLLTKIALAAPSTTLTMSPATASITVNQTASENITISTGTNRIVSADLIFTYNPTRMSVADITLGTFLPGATVIQKTIDNTNGKVTFSIYTTLANAKSGTGTLAVFTYSGKSVGSATVAFDNTNTIVYGVGEGNVLTGTSGLQVTVVQNPVTPTPTPSVTDTPVPTSPPSYDGGGGGSGGGGGGSGSSGGGSSGGGGSSSSGGSSASSSKTGDLNNDKSVNIFDLSVLLRNWNKSSTDSDLNRDGRVNIFDLSILLRNWGK